MEKIERTSMNLVEENVEKLQELFPEVFTEGKIDFGVLKELLGEKVETDNERYSFNWKGKSEARRIAQEVSTGTLRPEQSVLNATHTHTNNLYIEGDNLEVLKLLQKSYYKKVKMIYIDPPYNTGNDFVYEDDFKDGLKNYLEQTGQIGEEGQKLSTNTESSGRYHSNWLNMMYPRLKLARNLLTDDGVIFISINDNEVNNLRKIGNEIFGENNMIGNLIWKNKSGGANDSRFFAIDHEYILVFVKDVNKFKLKFDLEATVTTNYNYVDSKGKYSLDRLDKQSIRYSKALDYEIIGPDGKSYYPNHKDPKHPNATWRWSKSKVEKDFDKLVFKNGKIYTKNYEKIGNIARSLLIEERFGRTRTGKTDFSFLFDASYFSSPKPIKLIRHFLGIATNKDDIILDFFSGSATTAHAVMDLNAEDGGNRKFIMVQLPELTDEKSEAYKAGYKNICEIGKERIRRAGELIKERIEKENAQLKPGEEPKKIPDIGFKVFKLDSSNIKEWDPATDNLEKSLFDSVDNVKEDRTPMDLLYEILLKYGLDLNVLIEEKKDFYLVAGGTLIVNLENKINLETINSICETYKELLEIDKDFKTTVVLRDSAFSNDTIKTNAIKRLEQAGISEVKSI